GGLRIKKQAPARDEPEPLTRGFAASLLRSGEDLTEAEINRRASEMAASQIKHVQEAATDKHERALSQLRARVERAEAWKAEFEKAFGVAPNLHTSATDMAARVQLATQIQRRSFDTLARQAKALAGLIEEIEPTT
ncbi:MAG: hypothetical protein AAFR21_11515, partial [Pseudomonadota bacterium]